jgi:hypothetical protein
MEHKHLFILCPPASGSTLLWKILRTSHQVSALPVEGQTLVPDILFTNARWNPDLPVAWDKVKEIWLAAWDLNKPILLEKSPSHLVRAGQLEYHFPASFFLIMMRNPYAFCEGVKRRWGNKLTYYNIAKFWLICAKYQIDNIENLRHRFWFTYEDLASEPERVCRQIIGFVPELVELSPAGKFAVFEKSMPVENLNAQQISSLSHDDIFEINQVLKRYPEYLAYFNYRFIASPVEQSRLVIAKKMAAWMRSLLRLPDPLRWHNWKKLQ